MQSTEQREADFVHVVENTISNARWRDDTGNHCKECYMLPQGRVI